MKTMYKFPSIEQFRSIVRQVKDRATYVGTDDQGVVLRKQAVLPTLTFTGKVKLHGTNFSIVLTKDGEYYAQSRERILEPTSDNAGSCAYALKHQDFFTKLLSPHLTAPDVEAVVVYGEWAGQGVQKGVGISNVEKSFFVFALKLVLADGSNVWTNKLMTFASSDINLYNIDQFQKYIVDVDFNNPEQSVNRMIEMMQDVEQQCPVASYFGHSGIGEGIVFSCNDEVFGNLVFKVKGEKHSASQVKTLIPVDTEMLSNVAEFVEYALTENRLEQGVQQATEGGEPTMQQIGGFLSWINRDILKEEQDTLIKSGLDFKVVAKQLTNKARTWYISKYA